MSHNCYFALLKKKAFNLQNNTKITKKKQKQKYGHYHQ